MDANTRFDFMFVLPSGFSEEGKKFSILNEVTGNKFIFSIKKQFSSTNPPELLVHIGRIDDTKSSDDQQRWQYIGTIRDIENGSPTFKISKRNRLTEEDLVIKTINYVIDAVYNKKSFPKNIKFREVLRVVTKKGDTKNSIEDFNHENE